jgi:peptide/nickel transport system substrate-binding protein
MSWLRNPLAWVACLSMTATLAIGGTGIASRAAAAAAVPQHGGTLTLAWSQSPVSFDPTVPTDNGSIWTMLLIYDQLVRVAPNGQGVEPDVATHWTISKSLTTYTFFLRHGMTFSNGMPLTSADVVFSLDRAFKSPNWEFLFTSVKSVTAVGAYEVVIRLKQPDTALLSKLALFSTSIIPAKDYATLNAQGFQHPIGSGPFIVETWKPNESVTLVANPHYWQKPYPYLKKVVLLDVPDDNTRMLMARSDQAQVVIDLPYNLLLELEHESALTVHTYPVGQVNEILVNTKASPFNELDVRKAIEYAIDRPLLVQLVLHGFGTPANTFLGPMLDHCPISTCPGYTYNVALAKKYLSQSSVPHGFTATVQVQSGDELSEEAAVIIKQELAAIGITLKIDQMDDGTMNDDLGDGHYELQATDMTTDIIDPSENTQFAAVGDGGAFASYTWWNNATVDRLASEVDALTNAAQRARIYDQIQNLVNNGAAFIDLYYPPAGAAVSSDVHGFSIMETSNFALWKVWLSH